MGKMPSVVQFEKKRTVRQQEVQDDIVRTLNIYLKRAMDGEFVGIVIAAAKENGSCTFAASETSHFGFVLGAIANAQYRFQETGDIVTDDNFNDENPPEKDD